jgi:LPS export ABC transporter protein LptC
MRTFRTNIVFSLLTLVMLLAGCEKKDDVTAIPVYNGPTMELEEIETIFSDSGVTRVKMNAPVQQELQNGNREFPKGIFLHFYDEKGMPSSTLKSDMARYIKEENKWLVRGHVVIQSSKQNKKMTTEELWWDPTNQDKNKRITTSKFITIQTAQHLLTGEGLQANEDFTWYRIERPIGSFSVAP